MAKFTLEENQMARQTDIVSYLQHENEIARMDNRQEPYQLERDGKQIRVKGFGGLMVTGNMWSQRSTDKGGNTLDFLTEIEKIPYKQAMEKLLTQEHKLTRVNVEDRKPAPKEPFELPGKNETYKRVIAYLTKSRGLDPEIVLSELKKGNIYEDKDHHNAVFVGREPKSEEPRWAQKRTTLTDFKIIFDQPGSDPKYPYMYGNHESKTVILVESPIEALSYASLLKFHGRDPSQSAILALGGVHDTAVGQYLKDHPHVKNIITALNNDRAAEDKPNDIKGHEASDLIEKKFSRDIDTMYVKKVFPKGNDWNDDLRALRARELEKTQVIPKERTIEDDIKDYAKQKAMNAAKERGPMHSRSRSR